MQWINAKFPLLKSGLIVLAIVFIIMPILILAKSDTHEEAIVIASWVVPILLLILIPSFIFLSMKYSMQIREDGMAAKMRNVEVPAHAINKAELWVESNQLTLVFYTIDGLSNRITLQHQFFPLKADGVEALIHLIKNSSIPETEADIVLTKMMGTRSVIPADKPTLVSSLQERLDVMRSVKKPI